jgi:hypothetical protein
MAGIQDLIRRYAYGGPIKHYDGSSGSLVEGPQFGASTTVAPTIPTYSTDPTIQAALAALYGQSGDVNAVGLTDAQKAAAQSVADQRRSLFNQNAAYQANQNVQGLYGLNQANANTFLTDASAGLAPLTTGQNPNTQTYTPDAFKAMTAYEQALMANPKGANALLSEFTGTGANPLLGQYTTLPGGTIIPKAPTTTGAPAGTTSAANISNAGTTTGTTGTSGTTSGTTGTTGTSGTTSGTTSAPIFGTTVGSLFNPNLVKGVSYMDNDGYIHHPVAGGGEYIVNRLGIIVSYKPPTPTPTPTPTPQTYDWTDQDVKNAKNPLGQQLPTGSWFDPKVVPITGTPNVLDSGITLIPTANGTYAVDSKTNKILNYGSSVKPNLLLAKGGSVQMPQEYSRGNWKLI